MSLLDSQNFFLSPHSLVCATKNVDISSRHVKCFFPSAKKKQKRVDSGELGTNLEVDGSLVAELIRQRHAFDGQMWEPGSGFGSREVLKEHAVLFLVLEHPH
jgi:hypothetical protein